MAGSSRWASQAAQDAMLRFAPTRTSLAEALRTARETYGQTVHAGRATATLTRRAAQQALPQIQQAYGKANAAEQTGTTLVNSALASLTGPTADLFKGAQASEVNTQLANLLKAKASDEGLIAKQQVAAQEGAQFNQQAARATLQKTLAGLLSKSQATAQEEGLFGASEADKLAHEAETLEQRERSSQRSASTSRANAEEGARTSENNSRRSAASRGRSSTGKNGGLPPGYNTVDSHKAARSEIETIRQEAWESLAEHNHNRRYVEHELREPVQATSEKVEGKNVSTKGHPGYTNSALLQAGVDLAEKGGLSQSTVRQLHAAKYSVKELGYPVYRGSSKPKKNRGVSGEVQA